MIFDVALGRAVLVSVATTTVVPFFRTRGQKWWTVHVNTLYFVECTEVFGQIYFVNQRVSTVASEGWQRMLFQKVFVVLEKGFVQVGPVKLVSAGVLV
jgi:hypothetical protein